MSKWEYLTVDWHGDELRRVDGADVPLSARRNLQKPEWLRQLKSQGWELVTVDTYAPGGGEYYFFKRPLE